MSDQTPPRATIVVPMTGAPVQALRCLEGIAQQPEAPPFEVIVVDDASVGLESLLARLQGDVEVIRSPRRIGLAAAARLALPRARGEIVVLVRDAAAPAAGWLPALLAPLEDPAVGAAASVTDGDRDPRALAAYALAFRRADLSAETLPSAPDQLLFPEIALALAGRGLTTVLASGSVIAAPGLRAAGARQVLGETAELTVVIPTLDATADRVRACVAAIQSSTEAPHQIVLVDNGSPPQGFSGPVNAGLRAADTPYVVVMNDDVETLPGWWPPLRRALDAGATVAFPMTVDGPMRLDFPAWCFAMSAASVERFAHAPGHFFDPELVIWYQDTDLLHRLRKAGCPPVLADQAKIRHGLSQTVGSEDPELAAWIRSQVERDRARFVAKHPDAVLDGHALVA
jgi:GT2 family glycosyltransferase